jgi:hypothetical protein
VAGVFAFRRHVRRSFEPGKTAPLLLLGAAVLLQVYILGSIRGVDVILGSAFGFRQLTETLVCMAPWLALFLEHSSPRRYRTLGLLICGLVFWNLILICEYRYLLLPPDTGVSPLRMLANLGWLVHSKPLVLMAQTLAPLALALLLCRKEQTAEAVTEPLPLAA